jgi:hypothetical protein
MMKTEGGWEGGEGRKGIKDYRMVTSDYKNAQLFRR